LRHFTGCGRFTCLPRSAADPPVYFALLHIVVWSPLLVYFFLQRRRILEKTPFGIWAGLLFATDAVSLALDCASVFKWLAG